MNQNSADVLYHFQEFLFLLTYTFPCLRSDRLPKSQDNGCLIPCTFSWADKGIKSLLSDNGKFEGMDVDTSKLAGYCQFKTMSSLSHNLVLAIPVLPASSVQLL